MEVLERVRAETGVDLQVTSGEDEARLTFLAVRRWFGWSAGRLLVLDIGGGSLELAAGMDEDPDVALSLPLGAGRMTRRFLPGGGLGRPAGPGGAAGARRPRRRPAGPRGGEAARGRPARPRRRDQQDLPDPRPADRRGALLGRAPGPAAS